MSSSTEVIEVDTLIIGAGLIGSSVAMHLAQLGAERIRVLDFDLEGVLSSSELNAGGVRGTWVQPINIECSRLSIDYFTSVAEEVGYRACGYLWLQTPEKMAVAEKIRDRQLQHGWPVETWDVAEIRRRVPFIDKTDDLAGATFGPRDGLINPNLLKLHFRGRAKSRGVVFDDRTLLKQAEQGPSGVDLICERYPAAISEDQRREVLSEQEAATGLSPAQVRYRAKRVVNCAGAWAGNIARILGYDSPARPIRRQVSVFDCRDVDLSPYGMIIDTSGVYFHPEATNGLAGVVDPAESYGINYEYGGDAFFTEYLWPALYERSRSFERLRHLTGWAGLYEVSPDDSAIIGPVRAAGRAQGRMFECHSFSGHGVMHCYAAGLGLAEFMQSGKYQSIDLGPLDAARFERGELIKETCII